MRNVNSVTIIGNLTKDPELRYTNSGTAVCTLRIAVNGSRKDEGGNWVDDPNFFDVVVWGAQGENCNQYLVKGRPAGVSGRLNWREWKAKDGSKRQTVEVVADTVQFLGGRQDSGDRPPHPAEGAATPAAAATPQSDVPGDTTDLAAAPTGEYGDFEGAGTASDDDIPF